MKNNKMPEAEILQLRRANLKKEMIANASCYHRHISAEKWQEMDINCLIAWTHPNERIEFINEFERIKKAERDYEKNKQVKKYVDVARRPYVPLIIDEENEQKISNQSAEDLIERGHLPKNYKKVINNG